MRGMRLPQLLLHSEDVFAWQNLPFLNPKHQLEKHRKHCIILFISSSFVPFGLQGFGSIMFTDLVDDAAPMFCTPAYLLVLVLMFPYGLRLDIHVVFPPLPSIRPVSSLLLFACIFRQDIFPPC